MFGDDGETLITRLAGIVERSREYLRRIGMSMMP